MSIFQMNFDGKNKVEQAISLLQFYEQSAISFDPNGYYVAHSGGKDSVVINKLCEISGVKFKAHHNLTTLDPPELVRFVKTLNVEIHYSDISAWRLIEKKMRPFSRTSRYCCEVLKEGGGEGKFVVTGVRQSESAKRSTRKSVEFDAYGSKSKKANENRKIFLMSDNHERRRMLENCVVKGKHILNPIIDWTDSEVWEFIKHFEVPYCELYDKGFERIGCIGCPLGSNQVKELEAYPIYKSNYIKAFEKMLIERKRNGLTSSWETGNDVYKWFIKDLTEEQYKNQYNQIKMEELEDESN